MVNRVLKLNANQFASYMAALGPKFRAAAITGMRRAGLRTLQHVQRRTSEIGAVNTGFYRQAWKYMPTPDGSQVFNQAPYAGVIELGRRPEKKQPPLEAIARWAQRKLGLTEKQAWHAAVPIARAIAKKGIPGRYVLQGANEAIEGFVIAEVTDELKKALAKP